jgi:hypothetical protein
MIVILKTTIKLDPFTQQPASRAVSIFITDDTDAYTYDVGGLPLTGDLQAILDGMEADLWPEAQANGVIATPKDYAKVDRLVYLVQNPGAKAIFDLDSAEMQTQVNALVDAIIPAASAANRTKLKRVLAVGILVNRESVAGE